MPNLFGVDIQKEIYSALRGQLVPCTLTKVLKGERGSTLSGGLAITEKTYSCEGFIEDQEEVRINGTLISQGGKYVSILGGSIDGGNVIPEAGDRVNIEAKDYEITEIAGRDPAAAMFKCKVEV